LVHYGSFWLIPWFSTTAFKRLFCHEFTISCLQKIL